MKFLQFDLGTVKAGAIVVVTLDKQANVRLMDQSQFRNYRAGRRHTFLGGGATRSPVRVSVPRTGHWIVVVDTGGLSATVRAGVVVQPPPQGLLPEIRTSQSNAASRVAVREPEEPAGDVLGGQTWDVFLSHASEDKGSVARPLREALKALGVSVWLDEAELRIGDSPRRKIDQGIRSSRFGVIVLSKAFFSKGWTNLELDGIVTRNVAGEQSMLPIWHDLTADDVRRYSPSLADKVALNTSSHTIEEIAQQIVDVVVVGQ